MFGIRFQFDFFYKIYILKIPFFNLFCITFDLRNLLLESSFKFCSGLFITSRVKFLLDILLFQSSYFCGVVEQ
jgi:hypothetical protein